jgi:hypothetical protein
LSLLGLTIGLLVWLFPTPVISIPTNVSNEPNTLDVSTPPTHQPHVKFSPSSPIMSPSLSPSLSSESFKESSQFDQKKKKQKEKKKVVSSSVEPLTKVDDLGPSSIIPTLHQKSVTQVVDLFSSLVDPTFPLESDTKAVDPIPPINPILPLENQTQVVDLVLSSVDPTPPLTSAKVADLVPSLVSPTLPLKSTCVVDLISSLVNPTLPLKSSCVVDPIPSSVDPTLPLESKPDTSHIFLVDTESTMLGGIPHSPAKPPPINEAILFYWGVLTGPRLPSHIPFYITIHVCGQDVPQTVIDEGVSVNIFSFVSWHALGFPHLALVTQNMLSFNRRTSQPLGTLP